ncbi:MAG: GTP cyclohydrolase I [Clostridiales bacterium]|jgi:GTP cyclohydrolase I|nr:GTP cyclohydrolase I [Clostridiales bacterium]
MKQIDTKKIEQCIHDLLIALGDDPTREGLVDTPKRVARMYAEVFEGMTYTNQEIAEKFGTTFEQEEYIKANDKNLIVVKDIPIFSYCEHHLALMYNMKVSVVYRPVDKIIGLSKISRIADMVSKRLQLQERIAHDIVEVMTLVTESPDIGVYIQGEHSCMSARGIKKIKAPTLTTYFSGVFQNDDALRQEALLLMR